MILQTKNWLFAGKPGIITGVVGSDRVSAKHSLYGSIAIWEG